MSDALALAGLPALALAGLPALALAVMVACLAAPIPIWPAMLVLGGMAAEGLVAPGPVLAAALLGAVAGDGLGYAAGRRGGRVKSWLMGRPAVGGLIAEAGARLAARPWVAVFLSRWLVAPLGPYVNLAAGLTGLPPRRFWPPVLAGRALWLGGYLALGWAFAAQRAALGLAIGQGLTLVSGAVLAAGLGWVAWARWRLARRRAAIADWRARRGRTRG
jgi:membrane protein DedA with SNARE-associated domain